MPPAPGATLTTTEVRHDDNPTAPVPEVRPAPNPSGWDWLADAQRREDERLAQLRGEPSSAPVPFDPDRTNTAPIQLPR
jgi:hypothetical protein